MKAAFFHGGPEGAREGFWKRARGLSPSPRPACRRAGLLLRKEVIQPLVPQRLPCYDFIPITTHTFDGCFPCG